MYCYWIHGVASRHMSRKKLYNQWCWDLDNGLLHRECIQGTKHRKPILEENTCDKWSSLENTCPGTSATRGIKTTLNIITSTGLYIWDNIIYWTRNMETYWIGCLQQPSIVVVILRYVLCVSHLTNKLHLQSFDNLGGGRFFAENILDSK